MASRKFDLLIFGATGFTGKYVAAEAVRACPHKRLAIAGRTLEKLKDVIKHIEEETGECVSDDIGQIAADVSDQDSLVTMCRQTSVVVNCVGPFRFYGEQVVQACLAASTNYVDITGEPEFMQDMQLKYHSEAREKGIHIVSACGFDSIAADVGLELLREKFSGELTEAESYMNYHGGEVKGNYGTYNTIVQMLASVSNVKNQQKQIFSQKMKYKGSQLKHRNPGFSNSEQKWFVPFLGADRSVVRRTQYFEWNEHDAIPLQYGAYWCYDSFWQLAKAFVFGIILLVLSRCRYGVSILEKYPRQCSLGMFSPDGLTKKELHERSFTMVFHGKGIVNGDTKESTLKFSGPEIGYIFCSIAVVAAACTILDDKLKNSGGVLTPGSAFKGTSYVNKLIKRGVKIQYDE